MDLTPPASGYAVFIRDNATGETRRYHNEEAWDGGFEYLWTDGNYGCDCNRHLFFHRAAGIEPDWDRDCGESAYSAIALLPDGIAVDLG